MRSRVGCLLIASAALLVQPVFAVTHQIVFTENSSSSLSVTYDGGTTGISVFPSPTTSDLWSVFFPNNVLLSNIQANGSQVQWVEPENFSLTNLAGSNGSNRVDINSDFTGDNSFAGTTLQDGQAFANAGTDTSDGGSISIQFFDQAATSEAVPEPFASWLIVLGLLLLFGRTALRSRHSAKPVTSQF